MRNVPEFWKATLGDVEHMAKGVKKGQTEVICISAGGRPVYRIFYGIKNELSRTANLNSALGAGDITCYANKSSADYRPTLFLTGCIHGGEFEGTVAILNLINILETGVDLGGNKHPKLKELTDFVTLVLIPCANPDGRSRIPFGSFVGKKFKELRYYNQGTWKDGSLCNWPDCKKIHPIKDAVDYLGGYFNDDGINLMQDDFFGDKSAEVAAILKTTDEFAPDFSVLLHGGAETVNCFFRLDYVSKKVIRKIREFEDILAQRCFSEGLNFKKNSRNWEQESEFSSFNLTSAMHHVCGEPCIVYETNQGLIDEGDPLMHEEIYKHHILLFEELCAFIIKNKR
ncbi:MAG: hypothetical protein M0R40_02210 [Firmicutes bacterium]|nr:hypothetical protein [Bacillota bacterium]